MKVKFQSWAADELILAYLNFIRKSNSKTVYIKYVCREDKFRETVEGQLDIDDSVLKKLPKKIQFGNGRHCLELFQKHWKIKFHLQLVWDSYNECVGAASLSYDDSLKGRVYKHFKEFEPERSI